MLALGPPVARFCDADVLCFDVDGWAARDAAAFDVADVPFAAALATAFDVVPVGSVPAADGRAAAPARPGLLVDAGPSSDPDEALGGRAGNGG